jgi:hypothetical protein
VSAATLLLTDRSVDSQRFALNYTRFSIISAVMMMTVIRDLLVFASNLANFSCDVDRVVFAYSARAAACVVI